MTKEITKKDMAMVEATKGGEVKVGDIVFVTKKEYSSWVSIVGKVLVITDKLVKVATPIAGGYGNFPRVEVFESSRDAENFKLTFATKEDLTSTIFTYKKQLQKEKRELKEKYEKVIEFKDEFDNDIHELFGTL